MKKPNFNAVNVVTIVGTALSIGGSLLSAWANDKKTKETLAKLVDEKLAQK